MFSPSLAELKDWLHRDTRSVLLAPDFVSAEALPLILKTAFGPQASAHAAEYSQLCHDPDFRDCLSARLRLDATDPQDWKTKALVHTQELQTNWENEVDPLLALRKIAEEAFIQTAGEILRPVTSCVLRYQAFPCFISSSPDSLQRKLWKTTFLTMEVDNSIFEIPLVTLNYPFVLKDYENFVDAQTPKGDFETLSVTVSHMEQYGETRSLMMTYLDDLVSVDLARAPYAAEGRVLFQYLSGNSLSFEELMSRYLTYKKSLVDVCKCNPMPHIDTFFAKNIAGNDVRIPRRDLIPQLRHLGEDINYILDYREHQAALQGNFAPASYLFSLHRGVLYSFNCEQKTISQRPVPTSVHQSSLLLLDEVTLFSCGGVESGFLLGESESNQTGMLTLPGQYEQFEGMSRSRHMHGLVKWNEYIYALGGKELAKELRACEKFDLQQKTWEKLTQGLIKERANFCCFLYRDKIYSIGGETTTTVEILDPKTDTASVASMRILHPENCTGLFVAEETLLAFTKSVVYEVDLVTKQLVEKPGTGVSVWPQYPPVMHNNKVFVADSSASRLTFRWFSKDGRAEGQEEVRIA